MLGSWRLQLLREVARRGTIRAAAAAMSITPSAVSQQLKILELEAGAELLEHHGRLVRLTEAGTMLVRHADTITAAIVAAESELAAPRDAVAGTLRMAAFPTAARAMLPPIISSLGRRHPGLRLTLRDLETHENLTAIHMDEVDIAVVDEYDEPTRVRETGVDTVGLMRDPIHLALPLDHWSAGAAVELSDLRDDPWIMDTEGSTIYQAVLPGVALHDRPVRARVIPAGPHLERAVRAVVRPKRRRHPAVAAVLGELTRFGEAYAPSARP